MCQIGWWCTIEHWRTNEWCFPGSFGLVHLHCFMFVLLLSFHSFLLCMDPFSLHHQGHLCGYLLLPPHLLFSLDYLLPLHLPHCCCCWLLCSGSLLPLMFLPCCIIQSLQELEHILAMLLCHNPWWINDGDYIFHSMNVSIGCKGGKGGAGQNGFCCDRSKWVVVTFGLEMPTL